MGKTPPHKVDAWFNRAAREIPKYKSSAANEVRTADITKPLQQDAWPAAAGATEESSADSPDAEPARHSVSDSEHPATGVKAPAASAATHQQPSAVAASQKVLAQSSSDAYIHAVIPNVDAIFTENDFSSLDAQKR